MYPDGTGFLECPQCGTKKKIDGSKVSIIETNKVKDTIFLESEDDGPNITTIECPECGYGKAKYRQQVIWADEEEMVIYTCLKCKNAWRFGYSSGVSN